jgi:adenylate cyclase
VGPHLVDRRLSAILSADVVGYARLMEGDERETVRTLTRYRKLIGDLVRRRAGRVVDATGDSVLAEFGSVVEATECAVEIQQALREENVALPPHRRMHFRIGINLGDVLVEGERIYGDGVNIAARLEEQAVPGGICLSGSAFDQVEAKLSLPIDFLGEQGLKNIARPVRVYRVRLEPGGPGPAPGAWGRRRLHKVLTSVVAVLLVGGGVALWRGASPPPRPAALELPDRPSIAVLPFENLSGDPRQEYFSDGITEDLITGLSKVSGLFVIARNSVHPYKGKPVRPEQVSRELGVRYVLEGSVRKEGRRVRITAQLVDATTGYHLWAERYDRELRDIFAVQDEVTQKIVEALAIQLTEAERGRLERLRTDPEAYDLVLRGWEVMRRTTPESNAEARRLFARALELDPAFAKAAAGLGWAHLQSWQLQWSLDAGALDRAQEQAQRALARDESLTDAHRLLTQVYLWKKQHDLAVAQAERAVGLNPNDAEAYETLAEVLAWSGRAEESVGFIRRAMRLNPRYPFYYVWTLGHAYFLTGRPEEATAQLRSLLQLNPNFVAGHAYMAVLLAEQGREEEARAAGQEALRVSPAASLERLRERLPYRNQADLERVLTGLGKAGLT